MTINNIFSCLSSCYSKEPNLEESFEKHLAANDNVQVNEFITKHPELINKPTSCGYLPVELALTNKNIPLVQALLKSGALLNSSNNKRPSPLDQLILQDNLENLKATLGDVLSRIFSVTHASTKKTSAPAFATSLRLASTQLNELSQEITRFTNSAKLKESSPLFEMIDTHQHEALLEHLSQASNKDNSANFKAICYAAFSHNNKAVEVFYEVFGDEILKLQTTGLKNLYHIAAIADNSELIHKLSNWGLTTASNSSNDELGIYSPFHYAIMHPSLKTFIALTQTDLRYPSSIPLELLGYSTISHKIALMKLNPTQLLILKAYLTNPIPTTSLATKLYLSIEFSLWALELAKPYLNITQDQLKALNFVSNSLTIGRLVNFLSVAASEVKGSSLERTLKITSTLFYYSSIFSIFNNALEPFMSSAYKPLKVITSALMVKKVFSDFTRYQSAYLFRPISTLTSALKDLFVNALFVKNTFCDYENFLKEAKTEKDWSAYFKFSSNSSKKSSSSKRGLFNNGLNFKSFISPANECPTLFTSRALNLETIIDRIAQVDEKTYECCLKNVQRLGTQLKEASYIEKLTQTKSLSQHLVDCLVSSSDTLNDHDSKKVFRRLTLQLHPDKCAQKTSNLSDQFCTNLNDNYFTDFVKWFDKS